MGSRYGGLGLCVKEGRRLPPSGETRPPQQIVVAFSTPWRFTPTVGFRLGRSNAGWRLLALVLLFSLSAEAAGPTVMVSAGQGTEPARVRAVREIVASRRQVVDFLPLPPPGVVSTELIAIEQRGQAVRLALARARKKESEALWDDCVREVAASMSDAIEVIAATGELALLRDLHLQAGVCMSLADQGPGARLHFLSAALLDEAPPPSGLHREEAERVQVEARHEILARPRGKVRIVTEPPGARVLIDGREVPGATPLEADIRFGDRAAVSAAVRHGAGHARAGAPGDALRATLGRSPRAGAHAARGRALSRRSRVVARRASDRRGPSRRRTQLPPAADGNGEREIAAIGDAFAHRRRCRDAACGM